MAESNAKRAKVLRQSTITEAFDFKTVPEYNKSNGQQEVTVVPDSPEPCLPVSHTSEPMAEKLKDFIDEFEDELTFEPSPPNPVKPTVYGSPLCELNFGPSTYPILPPLRETANQCILVKPDFPKDLPPRPYPDMFRDVWNDDHVRMPCSKQCLYPVGQGTNKEVRSKWDLVKQYLQKPVNNSKDLEEAILGYNTRQRGKWRFDALHAFFLQEQHEAVTRKFFSKVLPKVIELALCLPNIVTHGVPLLKKQQDYSLTMSQKQAACILANAFLCTFPFRNTTKMSAEYSNYPSINFNSLFGGHLNGRKKAKLKCVFHYFDRVTSSMPLGTVTYHRQVLGEPPNWSTCEDPFTKLHITSSGLIENVGTGMLQVDFANRCVGGGVLGNGCVQEEIRFIVCPELIVARLFTEHLDNNECLIITGCEQYSYYNGYGDTFRWSGDFIDETIRDDWRRRQIQLVAIDAINFYHNSMKQFSVDLRLRELNKAYCGFFTKSPAPSGHFSAVATGNWGCGAFKGDIHLKAILQLMAAARARRDVVYTTFGNRPFAEELEKIHTSLIQANTTIAQVWTLLSQYCASVQEQKVTLFQFLHSSLSCSSDNSTNSQTLEYSI